MAGWTGLEPATFCVTGRRSNQLSYHPVKWERERNVESEENESSVVLLFQPDPPRNFFTAPRAAWGRELLLAKQNRGDELCSDGMNSLSEISVGAMAVAANRGELTVEVVAALDFAWFEE